jgi:hypothetical protein
VEIKRTKTLGLIPVNIYVLTKMPRDCTAPSSGRISTMNSPVSCLPDPIQNMGKTKKNTKTKKTTSKKKTKNTPFLQQLAAPVAYGSMAGNRRNLPIATMSNGGSVVKNYEQCFAFPAGNGAFTVGGFDINPGVVANFPWLNTLARNYQKFRFLYLRFFYSSSVSTATPGKVWMSYSYDAQDAPPSSLATAMASSNSTAGPVWFGGAINEAKAFDPSLNGDANVFIDVDVAKWANNWYYVRNTITGGTEPSAGGALSGVIPAGLTFTQGSYVDEAAIPAKLFYGTNGLNAGVVPGELYVSYICEFCEAVAPADAV